MTVTHPTQGRRFLCLPGSVEFLNSGKVLPANLPFSEAVRVGNTVYLFGQIGIVLGTMNASGGIKEEARQTIENIESSLEAHGYSSASKGGSRDT